MSSLEVELLELGGDITTALEEIPMPAFLLDKDGLIRWQNKASIALRGRRVGIRLAQFVAPDEKPDVFDVLSRVICSGEPAEFTFRVLNREGRYVPVEFSAVPVRGGDTVVAIFGLGRDAETTVRAQAGPRVSLTERQREVLRLLADGRSTKEIASELSLSTTTVRNHIANLTAALGVHSRLQAVVAASRAGLLGPQARRGL